jgi:hypothetical protein
MSKTRYFKNKGVFKVGDSVRFTDEFRTKVRDDSGVYIVKKIEQTTDDDLITFEGVKKKYAKEASSGDDGYIPSYSSYWLEKA